MALLSEETLLPNSSYYLLCVPRTAALANPIVYPFCGKLHNMQAAAWIKSEIELTKYVSPLLIVLLLLRNYFKTDFVPFDGAMNI